MPNYTEFCFKLLGTEIFSFCLGRRGQTITEPYVPNSHERCEDQCCEPDARPFPEPNRDNNNTNVPGKKKAGKYKWNLNLCFPDKNNCNEKSNKNRAS